MTRQKELASLIERGLQTEHVAESEGCFFEDVFGIILRLRARRRAGRQIRLGNHRLRVG